MIFFLAALEAATQVMEEKVELGRGAFMPCKSLMGHKGCVNSSPFLLTLALSWPCLHSGGCLSMTPSWGSALAFHKCSESSCCPQAHSHSAHSWCPRLTLCRHRNKNYTSLLSQDPKWPQKQGYYLWVEACNSKSKNSFETIFLEI